MQARNFSSAAASGTPLQRDERFEQLCSRYSVFNMIRGLVDPAYAGGGLEREVSQELAKRSGASPVGVLVPFSVFGRGLVVGTPTAGGHTVATELYADKFIELLRPVSIVANLGATYLNGLVGNVAIPRATSTCGAYWVNENEAPSESQGSFDQVPLQPKTLGAYTDISRKMMLQSSLDISSFVITDLRASLGAELDRVVFNGAGGNQSTGILNDSRVSTTSLGTNGAALTWGNIVDLETQVSQQNADGKSMAYVTTKQARRKLSQTSKVAGQNGFIWESAENPSLPGEGAMNGLRAIATTLLPDNLTKGSGSNLSAMVLGNWSDMLVGQWGAGIDISVDPYTLGATGAVRILAMTDVDFALRHPESFIKIKDIVTA